MTQPPLEAALAGGPLPDLTAVPADALERGLRHGVASPRQGSGVSRK